MFSKTAQGQDQSCQGGEAGCFRLQPVWREILYITVRENSTQGKRIIANFLRIEIQQNWCVTTTDPRHPMNGFELFPSALKFAVAGKLVSQDKESDKSLG